MWLPDFLLPESAAGFGPVSKIVGGGVGVVLIAMASLALLPTHNTPANTNVTTLAQASGDWQQQVSDQASKLSDACAQAGQVAVPADAATDDGVVAATAALNTTVTNSCAFGTLHQMQQALYGTDTRAWTQDAVTTLVNQGQTAADNLTTATNSLTNAISLVEGANSQTQLATALATYEQQTATVGPLISTAQNTLASGTPADASTATDLQAEITACNGAMTADQTSVDALIFANTTLTGCATDLPKLTTALLMSQLTSTSTPSPTKTTTQPAQTQTSQPTQQPATQPPATQPPATQPPATQPPATTPPTQAPKQSPSIGRAQVVADSGTSLTVSVWVTDPDHVGYTVCFYNGSQSGSTARNSGSQTVSGTVPVSSSAPRNPGAMLC